VAGRSRLIMVQAQRPDLVILVRSVHGRHRIALVELTCPWDTDAKRVEERKASRYVDLKTTMRDCSLYVIEVGERGHILKLVKDPFSRYSRLKSLQATDQVLGR
jgi:hypothetical protein